MAFDAARYVHRYYASLAPAPGNEYPRLRAWEYLWEYVWDPSRSWDDLTAPEQLDTTALHLGFYLANWGMFRGSSGLLQNSNLALVPDRNSSSCPWWISPATARAWRTTASCWKRYSGRWTPSAAG